MPGVASGKVALPDATDVGAVTLRVADLKRAVDFYVQRIGLKVLSQEDGAAALGAGDRPIVRLVEVAGAQPQPPNTTGLYHAAILFPDRQSLAVKVAQLAEAGVPLGQGDHLVSEAFYLSDPDGNGLELYRDRPRSKWEWDGGNVRMATNRVDLEGMFAEIRDRNAALADPAAPEGTKLGHMHLRVADIPAAEKFYVDTLGFGVTAHWQGALFVSAGGYHHHVGMNTWESRGGRPAGEHVAGLREFSLVLPDRDAIEALLERVRVGGYAIEGSGEGARVVDPFENRIELVTAAHEA